jgi:hypothetical protein
MNFAGYFDEQIRVQQRAIRSYRLCIVPLVAVGMGLIVYSLVLEKDTASDIIKLGGGIFATALAALPYKEITPRRERIVVFTMLKQHLENMEDLPIEERQLFEQMAIDAIKENLKR